MKRLLCGLCVSTAIVFCMGAQAVTTASISVVGPNTFEALPGTVLSTPFAVRVVDAQGVPLSGLIVDFFANTCLPAPLQPYSCPAETQYSAYYGTFGGGASVATGIDGVATAPIFTAGSLVGSYDVVAGVYRSLHPENGNIDVEFLDAPIHINQIGLAARVPITASFTGAWYDPNQSGHGILLEVLPGNRVLAYWFAHSPDGQQQAWFGGDGAIVGDVATIKADQGVGGGWIPNFNPAEFHLQPWGTFTFSFSDCNHGRVDFASYPSDYGANHMDLTRLTLPAGLTCP